MKYLSVILFSLALTACSTSSDTENAVIEDVATVAGGIIEFAEPSFSFGEITEGEVVSHTFEFTNKGTAPIEVLSVNVSCGCTVASKPMGQIAAGASSEITINFNSAGKVGLNRKSVGVFSNASNSQETLTFTATVMAADS